MSTLASLHPDHAVLGVSSESSHIFLGKRASPKVSRFRDSVLMGYSRSQGCGDTRYLTSTLEEYTDRYLCLQDTFALLLVTDVVVVGSQIFH